jgi:hypothetical protein
MLVLSAILTAKNRCCIDSRLIYEPNTMLGLQVVPHYDATLQHATCCFKCAGATCCCYCLILQTCSAKTQKAAAVHSRLMWGLRDADTTAQSKHDMLACHRIHTTVV